MAAPGALIACFIDGKTRKGSDLGLKLKYLAKGLWMRKLVSIFIFSK